MTDEITPTTNGSQKAAPATRKRTVKLQKRRTVQLKREQVSSDSLPKRSLEDALKVAAAIKDNYGKTGATWEQIAVGMGVSSATANNKYLLWSATAYGIISKEDHDVYMITETGRKILAPTVDGEDREGIIKAIATPSAVSLNYLS